MAGSPGAGKTEFSKFFVEGLNQGLHNTKIARLDTDEVREFIPQYKSNNSREIQAAAALGVEYLFDYCQKHNINMLLDGTFATDISLKNVERER